MESKKLDNYKKFILKYLNDREEDVYSFDMDIFDLATKSKIGPSKEFIAKTIADYVLEGKVKPTSEIIDLVTGLDIMTILINNRETLETAIKIFDEFRYEIPSNKFLEIVVNTMFNMDFFLSAERNYYYRRRDIEFLLFTTTKNNLWDTPKSKPFFINFFNDDSRVDNGSESILKYFHNMGEIIKRFIILKTNFLFHLTKSEIQELLNEFTYNEINIYKLIVRRIANDVYAGRPQSKLKLYNDLPIELKDSVFPTEKIFYENLLPQADDVSFLLYNFDSSTIVNFFKYYPEYHKTLDLDSQAVLKFHPEVPEEIKNQIGLPTTQEVFLVGRDMTDLIYTDRDNSLSWVKAYIDDTLWEDSLDWNYDVDVSTVESVYWRYITEENKNKIKEFLQEENPSLNLDDENTLKRESFSDDTVKWSLTSAAEEGEKAGDVNKLIEDIEKVLNELFPNGWTKTISGINAILSLDTFDVEEIREAFLYLDDWDVSDIWFRIMSEKDRRDKPSLPEYRYGIGGDFDISTFNDHISDKM